MKIKKNWQNNNNSIEEVIYDIQDKEELLSCPICKNWVDRGYEIAFLHNENVHEGLIIAIRSDVDNKEEGCIYFIIGTTCDIKNNPIIANWLPNVNDLRAHYREIVKYRY